MYDEIFIGAHDREIYEKEKENISEDALVFLEKEDKLITPGKEYQFMPEGAQYQEAVPIVAASGSLLEAEVGKYYRFEEPVGTLEIVLPTPSETDKLCGLEVMLTTGSAPALTVRAEGEVGYFSGYSIEADTTYELNFLFDGAKWIVAYGIVE